MKNFLRSYLHFFFRTQSLLMDKFIKNKRDLEVVTSCSLGYKASSQKIISHILPDQV